MDEHAKFAIVFEVKFVDELRKLTSGKWKTCVQKLNIESFK